MAKQLGKCKCGEVVYKMTGRGMFRTNGIRYCYPEDVLKSDDIFRCKNCKEVIEDTWVESEEVVK